MGQVTSEHTVASSRPEEARIQAIGRELFDRVNREKQQFFKSDRWTSTLFE